MDSSPEPAPEPEAEASGSQELVAAFSQLSLVPKAKAQPKAQPTDLVLSDRRGSGNLDTPTIIRRVGGSVVRARARRPVDLRYYAVWHIPNYTGAVDLIGLHSGEGSAAYDGILASNSYIYTRIRFRRADSLEEARRLFEEEAPRHSVAVDRAANRIHWE